MFRRLNREEGITLVLVTHDMNVARYADRIIFIKDGLIADPTLLSADEPPVARSHNGSASNGASRGNGVAVGNVVLRVHGLVHRSEHPESGTGIASPCSRRNRTDRRGRHRAGGRFPTESGRAT